MMAFISAFAGFFFDEISKKATGQLFDLLYSHFTHESFEKKFSKTVKNSLVDLKTDFPDYDTAFMKFLENRKNHEHLLKLLFIRGDFDAKNIKKYIAEAGIENEDLIETFISILKKNLLLEEDFRLILMNNELLVSILGIHERLEVLINNSNISGDTLLKIKENLEKENTIDKEKLNKFLNDYRNNCKRNLTELNFVNFGLKSSIKKERKNIKDIYVEPNFRRKFPESENERLPISRILKVETNLIVLGKPGTGKSLFANYLMYDFLSSESSLTTLPLKIELRKYLNYKVNTRKNIITYLEVLIEESYGLKISETELRRIFHKDDLKIVFFFDGLDEIFDSNLKIEVKNDIQNFSSNYPNVKVIVTSRIDGYTDAAFDSTFTECNIIPFNRKQIKEFIEKWYDAKNLENNDKQEYLNLVENIFDLSDDLISNPLLLTLIVILYRNNLKLPESKLEIYSSCTETLVSQWEDSKQLSIDIDSKLLKKRKSIFTDLAFWQYEINSEKDLNEKLSFPFVKHKVAEIINNQLELEDDWEAAMCYADNFLNYAEKRSIYFENNFTHKTFLEYYTARWIFTNYYLKHQNRALFNELIVKYSSNSYWSVVLELLINMIDDIQNDNSELDNLFSFLLKNQSDSLAFMVEILPVVNHIGKSTKRELIRSGINFCIDNLEYNAEIEFKDDSKNKIVFNVFSSIQAILKHKELKNILFETFNNDIYLAVKHDKSKILKYLCFFGELNYHNDCNIPFPYFKLLQELRNEDANIIRGYFNAIKKGKNDYYDEYLKECEEFFGRNNIFKKLKSFYTFEGNWNKPIAEFIDYYLIDNKVSPKQFEEQINKFNLSKEEFNLLFKDSMEDVRFVELEFFIIRMNELRDYQCPYIRCLVGLKFINPLILFAHSVSDKEKYQKNSFIDYLKEKIEDPDLEEILVHSFQNVSLPVIEKVKAYCGLSDNDEFLLN